MMMMMMMMIYTGAPHRAFQLEESMYKVPLAAGIHTQPMCDLRACRDEIELKLTFYLVLGTNYLT